MHQQSRTKAHTLGHAIGFDANLSYNPVYDDGAIDTLAVCHKLAVATTMKPEEQQNLAEDIATFENHAQDSRIRPIDVMPTMGASNANSAGVSGNNPLVVFSKASHARNKNGDGERYEAGEVAQTRNTFDNGESRAQEVVVQPAVCKTLSAEGYDGMPDIHKGNGMPIAAIALDGDKLKAAEHDRKGGNGIGWNEDGSSYTETTRDRHAVAMCVDAYNQSATNESCMTLRSAMTGTDGNDADPKVVQSAGFMIAPSAKTGSIGAQLEESPTLDTNCAKGVAIGFKAGQSANGGLGDEIENAPTLSHNPSALEPTIAIGIDQQGGKSSAATAEDISPTMLSDSHGTPNAVAFAQNTRDETRLIGGDGQNAGALSAEPGMKQQTYVSLNHIVRRLTPGECETLQGFPRDWTKIPYRNKPADQCPDSPRFKALGNSWATNCAEWILRRIVAADRLGLIP